MTIEQKQNFNSNLSNDRLIIPRTLLEDSYLLVENHMRSQGEYQDTVSLISSPLGRAKLEIIDGTEPYLKSLHRYWIIQWINLLIALFIIYLAWSISWWWLAALLLCVIILGRVNHNQTETNMILASYLIAFDRLLEDEPWRSTEEGLNARSILERVQQRMPNVE